MVSPKLALTLKGPKAIRGKTPIRKTPLCLIPKDEVKDVSGRSPEIGETLLMRAWFEIQPFSVQGGPGYQ